MKCKTCIFCNWNKSPGQATKTLKVKIVKKFSRCFSRLEGIPVRESWKSLCTFRDWTFHSRTSRQNRPASSWLWHATWMTRNWVAKTRQHYFWNFSISVKTKYFPKTPKTLKNLFVFESTKIKHVKTYFIKYNHTNEYGIHWT